MPQFETCDVPPEDAAAVVDRGLGDFNDAAAPLHLVDPLAIVAREGGTIIGGAVGRTWGIQCELQQLWVAPEWRRRGVARGLVQRFESRAIERGCTDAYLYTFSFQAPTFYEALGYARAHTLRGYPQGIEQYLMTRHLGARAADFHLKELSP